MTPNILESGGAGATPGSASPPPRPAPTATAAMDGDRSAKTMEQGANSALKGAQDMTEGVDESVKQTPALGDKATGSGTSVFSKEGAIGRQFNADGAVGGTAQSIGGPFDKQGLIGKHFNADGRIGGAAQGLAERNEQH